MNRTQRRCTGGKKSHTHITDRKKENILKWNNISMQVKFNAWEHASSEYANVKKRKSQTINYINQKKNSCIAEMNIILGRIGKNNKICGIIFLFFSVSCDSLGNRFSIFTFATYIFGEASCISIYICNKHTMMSCFNRAFSFDAHTNRFKLIS